MISFLSYTAVIHMHIHCMSYRIWGLSFIGEVEHMRYELFGDHIGSTLFILLLMMLFIHSISEYIETIKLIYCDIYVKLLRFIIREYLIVIAAWELQRIL